MLVVRILVEAVLELLEGALENVALVEHRRVAVLGAVGAGGILELALFLVRLSPCDLVLGGFGDRVLALGFPALARPVDERGGKGRGEEKQGHPHPCLAKPFARCQHAALTVFRPNS